MNTIGEIGHIKVPGRFTSWGRTYVATQQEAGLASSGPVFKGRASRAAAWDTNL
jgi:hypothetical protein